ncbi:MAG: hypothetical protein IPG97_00380 [Microthrixaceae bacterium]|nr:hypothetical protein [Microthrixaceae bacterium]
MALTEEFLSRVEVDRDFYEALRDEFEPGAPMWITETAEAACGGDRWASFFRRRDPLRRQQRSPGQGRRRRGLPQHAGGQRLRPHRRGRLHAAPN